MKIEDIINNKELRIEACKQSISLFGFVYLPQYFNFKSASFQTQLYNKLEDDDITRLAECNFRESGKSVVVTLIYILWNICYQKRKFIILGSETGMLANILLGAVINVLQGSDLLKDDFGVLYFEKRDAAGIFRKKTVSDFTTENNIRIIAKGKGGAIRGLRHLEHRPDLYIGDDLDSLKSVLNTEQRDKTYNYLKAEVMSGINQEYGKVVIIGNMIHFDCLMARLKKDKTFNYHEVPIYKNGKLAWPERHFWTEKEANKYNQEAIHKEDKKTSIEKIKEDKGSLIFAQEYLLQPMSDKERIFRPEWIKYYDKLPRKESLRIIGRIDPAAKEKETSDYSAIAIAVKDITTGLIYITYVWQGKVSEATKADKIYGVHKEWDTEEFLVEDNAYQDVLRQRVVDMKKENKYVPVRGITTIKDKVSRALAIQPYIERGDVLFNPNLDRITKITGDNKSQGFFEQLVQFPIAPNDDMVDAVIGVIERLIKSGSAEIKEGTKNPDESNETAGLMTKQF